MPTDVGRALSIQQQFSLELIAEQSGVIAAAMLREYASSLEPGRVDEFSLRYEAMVLGAVSAIAATRVGYLMLFAQVEAQPVPNVPLRVMAPTAADVLADGLTPRGAVESSLRQMARHLEQGMPQAKAATAGAALLTEYAESTSTSAADYVDREVLGPDRRIAALRRVAHPQACDRCQRVSGILVFKHYPSLRHPQCRCSFEPVYATDVDYAERLAKYRANFGDTGTGPAARDRRHRGRVQLEDAQFRAESEWLQDEWTAFLRDEQTRIAKLVTTVKSNTYREWAVMTSATQAEVGNGLLPVITRDGESA